MFVNNEIGTVQDLRKLFKAFNGYGLIYHTDAVQAVGHIPVDVKEAWGRYALNERSQIQWPARYWCAVRP